MKRVRTIQTFAIVYEVPDDKVDEFEDMLYDESDQLAKYEVHQEFLNESVVTVDEC